VITETKPSSLIQGSVIMDMMWAVGKLGYSCRQAEYEIPVGSSDFV
jgi:hypothetical protein